MDSKINLDQFILPEKLRQNDLPPILLASDSPRRRELFSALGLSFQCQGAEVCEDRLPGELPETLALRLACEKANRVARQHPSSLVLGADTLVVGMGFILGKPAGASGADAMLRLLSGRTHRVLTGVALVNSNPEVKIGFVECTRVSFRHLTKTEIESYIRNGEPLDKAGAYGIQGRAKDFVRRIEGSYTNVVGLPLEPLRNQLIQLLENGSS